MVFQLIPAQSRGHADHGWLKTYYTFSFAGYHNPHMMQFESLRVINDDRIAAGKGFPTHPHNDVEIFSYIVEGVLEHKDTMGNGSRVSAGGIQFMSAGSGVSHSEFNGSADEPVHLLQIWLLPDKAGVTPRYETLQLSDEDKRGKLKLFISSDGRDGSIRIQQDANIYAALVDGDDVIEFVPEGERRGWIQMVKGKVFVNGALLSAGDGAAFVRESITIERGEGAEFILFDLAPYH